METAELSAIGIAPDVDIHCAKCMARSAVFMTGKEYESCTGGKDGKSIEDGALESVPTRWDFGVIAHPVRSRGTSQPLRMV